MTHTSFTMIEWTKYLFEAEVYALKSLVLMLPNDPHVINIGAGSGTSGLCFCESRPDLRLTTIDKQKESSPFGCLEGERLELQKAGYWGDRTNQIHGDSKQIGFIWGEKINTRGKVDMVFVDGDHSYEGCSGDINNWTPNIKKGGILAIHDYCKEKVYSRKDLPANRPHPKPWPEVDQSVQDLLVGNDKFEHVLTVETLIAFRVK